METKKNWHGKHHATLSFVGLLADLVANGFHIAQSTFLNVSDKGS